MTRAFPEAPPLDTRDADMIVRELVQGASAYAPGWRIGTRGSSTAAAAVFARYAAALIERINRAPDKHQLAFLDLLGVDLLPAHAARAPLVVTPLPSIGDAQMPAGTRVGAKVAGADNPVMFETEQPVGVAAARLAEVVTVHPGRDAFADHSAAVAGGLPVTLWSPLTPVDHELYLAHEVHFALAGNCTVGIEFVLSRPGSEPLALVWEYWDGELWRGFRAFESDPVDPAKSFDGTLGLTRTGTVRLAGDCCDNVSTTVNGAESLWLRARLAAPLPLELGRVMPTIDRVLIRSIINRRIPAGADGLLPDAAHANGTKLDLSATFLPLGQAGPGSVLTITSAEAFSKPGAVLTVQMLRSKTSAEQGDDETAAFEAAVNSANTKLEAAIKLLRDTVIPGLTALRDGTLTGPPNAPAPWTGMNWGPLFAKWIGDIQGARKEILDVYATVPPISGSPAFIPWYELAVAELDNSLKAIGKYLDEDTTAIGLVRTALTKALADVTTAVTDLKWILSQLLAVNPASIAVGLGAKPPKLMAPDVAWEYWDGTRWIELVPTAVSDPGAAILQPTPATRATITFTVPPDWEETTLNGLTGRFLRARLERGGYGVMRTVSWKDQDTQEIKFMPIVESRPPTLDSLTLGYYYESPAVAPERCVVHGDFQWTDRTIEAMSKGDPFPPFAPVEDTAPTLYLGFDAALPADAIGIWFDVVQDDAQAEGPQLRWEYAEGTTWLPLSVTDETVGLVQPGIAGVMYPGVETVPSALVLRGEGRAVTVRNDRNSPRFNPGDILWIEQEGKGELVTVRDRQDDVLQLVNALSKTYDRGTIARARLARFGTPRTWIRARMLDAGDPPESEVLAVLPNAVWVSQRQSIANELLGSGNGQPNQACFTREAPVLPGEAIEVRELEGARANVEYEILRRELLDAGMDDADCRTVLDPRTGRIREVWVRWQSRRTLLFSRGDDRHYAIERSRGRVIFGDGRRGRVPPAGVDNIRVARYKAGGGPQGNVPAGSISQLLSGVPAQQVSNPRAAEGGCIGESQAQVLVRGPRTVRHRRQAISRADFEALAREASPAVALVRAQPATDAWGRSAPGSVTLFIVPQSTEARPVPSLALRRGVREFLRPRVPAGVRDGLAVVAPRYYPVGLDAAIAVRSGFQAGALRDGVLAALAAFLHPLTGGPDGAGWPFGRDVFLSDIAAMLESEPGIDYVESLVLTSENTARGDAVAVPADRLVCAGDFRVSLTAPAR